MAKTSLSQKFTNWVTVHRVEFIFLVSILLIGAFTRLFRIGEYMTFLGDEGRDAIVVRNLLVHADPILVGPGTSIGNMYLGPLYYYLSAPFLFLANFSPVGPSLMVAIFGVAAIYLVWHIVREWFPHSKNLDGVHVGALAAAFLYAISPVVVIYNRSSWNPNIMPFFSLLCIYGVWRVWKYSEFKWLVVLGISFAFVMQSHYLGLVLLPVLFLFWLIAAYVNNVLPFRFAVFDKFVKKKDLQNGFWRYSFVGLIIFLFLMSPLVIFDARHGWNNFNAIKTFFTVRQDTVSARPWAAFPKLWPLWEQINTRLLGGMDKTAGRWVAFGLFDGTVAILVMKWWRKKHIHHAFFVVVIWILVSLVGLASYKHELYDHYYGFLFTAPFLLLGGITQDIIDVFGGKKAGVRYPILCLLYVSLIGLFYINLLNSPLHYPPNRQLQRSETVAAKIIEEAGGKKLNLAVIAERNYEGAYQYFLEKENAGFVKIDPLDTSQTIADQLYVVCELPKDKCDPTHNPKTEIANFGWSEIEKEWSIEGVTLYKLKHSEI